MSDGGGISSSIGEMVADGLKAGAKGVKQELVKGAASAASQVTGQTYTPQTPAQQSKQITNLKAQEETYKTEGLTKTRAQLEQVKHPQPQEASPTPKLPKTILDIEHHRDAQDLDKPTEEEMKKRQEQRQKEQIEFEEKQRKDDEEKQKRVQFVEPTGKQTGPNFGKKPKKPLQVQMEQTKTESKHGVGG